MKLQRLKINNYKSLRNVSLNFKSFNVFVGKNNVGKTNILDCLKFISELAKDGYISLIFEKRGGYDKIVFGGLLYDTIKIDIIFKDNNDKYNYFIEFNKDEIIKERVIFNKSYLMNRLEPTKFNLINPILNKETTETIDPNRSILLESMVPHYKAMAKQKQFEFDTTQISKLINYLKSWKFYRLNPSSMRKPLRIKKTYDVGESGNLSALVLHNLMSEYWKIYKEIEETLSAGIKEIEELKAPLDDADPANTYIAIKEKGFDNIFTYHQMSDGTLNILAHLLIIYSPEKKGLIGIEEPEDFIHPSLLKYLRDILKSTQTQLIAITHSPYFVDALQPEDVFAVKKINGETKCEKFSKRKELLKFLKELTLGEIVFSGELEDFSDEKI